MTDSTVGPATESANASKESVIYAPSHLAKIREMYINGAPIALPEQLEEERDELDAQRAAFAKSQGSTDASGVATLRSSSTDSTGVAQTHPVSTTAAGSTAARPIASPAGTAGSSTSAQ